MGSFKGHTLGGSLHLLFGLWWSVKSFLKFFSRTAKPSPLTKRIMYRLDIAEWTFLLCATLVGIIGEQFVDHGPHLQLYSTEGHKWIYLHIWQHTTMYLFFAMAALVNLLTVAQFQIPLGLDRLMVSLALFNEGLIFCFHIAHRPPLDYHLHFMLIIALFSGAFGCLLEVWFRENLILEMFRASMFLIQGSWLWQIAFVLYPQWETSNWDQNDHENVMFITMCFSWHYAACILLMSVIYSIIYCHFKHLERKSKDSAIEIEQLNQTRETYTLLANDVDED